MEKLEEELWDIFIGAVSGLAFSVLILMAISYFFAGFILKPVRIINEQARDISEKHLDRRVPVTGSRDEFNALAQALNQVFDRLQHAFIRQKRLLADASHELKTPLTIILDNAIKYNVSEGQVKVIGDQSGTEIIVSVENTGAGVDEAEIHKVFDQFYRVEKSRSIQHGGTGLGLAIVKRIVELHGGRVKFESQQKGLTRVTVSLARRQEKIPV